MIAIIAGTGNLPVEACKSLLEKKQSFFVISLFPQDNLDKILNIVGNSKLVVTQKFYKATQILKILKERNVTKVLLIGKVDKRNTLKKIKLDWITIKFFASLVCRSDTTMMEKIVSSFNERGFQVLNQNEILQSLFIPPGILTGKLTPELKENIDFGINIAEKISEFDIGQTVVVKDKMILAIEAIEGTDSCIKRGIELGQNNVVICKAARKNQSKKFDLPTLGPDSLKNIKKNEVQAIAWTSNQTFIADKELFIAKARGLGITLISV
ncbi:MAG: UDP-2,3-diacylglucosamine diphosphatase LpxI [bacterium]